MHCHISVKDLNMASEALPFISMATKAAGLGSAVRSVFLFVCFMIFDSVRSVTRVFSVTLTSASAKSTLFLTCLCLRCRNHIARWWRWGQRICGKGWWWSLEVKKGSTMEEWRGKDERRTWNWKNLANCEYGACLLLPACFVVGCFSSLGSGLQCRV